MNYLLYFGGKTAVVYLCVYTKEIYSQQHPWGRKEGKAAQWTESEKPHDLIVCVSRQPFWEDAAAHCALCLQQGLRPRGEKNGSQ